MLALKESDQSGARRDDDGDDDDGAQMMETGSGVHFAGAASAHGRVVSLVFQISSPTHTSILTSGDSCSTCPPWRGTPPTWSRRS